MPLPKPSLDNRGFDQLVAEGRGQIPRLAPQWTDYNASDPGIALAELAAWLTEQSIYRFDRPSDEARRAFARLAGIRPRAPGVARTVVAISDPNGVGTVLPARMQLASVAAKNKVEVVTECFESMRRLFVSSAKLKSVATGYVSHALHDFDALLRLTDATSDNSALRPYLAFGARPRADHALFLGFDRMLVAPGKTLALHVWTEAWERDGATRAALETEYEALLDELKKLCPCEMWKAAKANPAWHRHYRVQTVWEYYVGAGQWRPFANVEDETRALTLSGFVRFTAPVEHQAGGGAGRHFYIRCRIRSGRFECPPRLAHIAFNAVGAEHALTRPWKEIGPARGHAQAVFPFADPPIAVIAGRTRLRLAKGLHAPQTDWREVLDWDRSGAHDRHFRVTPERGELQSGDGLRAEVLPAGYALYVRFQEGGGDAGNIAAGTLDRLPPNATNTARAPAITGLAKPLVVSQPFAAIGGTARETLGSVEARAYECATRVDKAVTAADFERLAIETPGVPVARAHAVPGMHPALPCYSAPGAVTLIVVPRCPLPAPRPSRALLDAVLHYLLPRRLVTCEIHAAAPVYRRITVHATLQLGGDAVPAEVRKRAIAAVNALFDPLTGGPDQTGWPIGRTVYRNELLALLAGLDGVARVTDFGLQGRGDRTPRCGNVELCAHELVVPGRHKLQLSASLPTDLKRSDPHVCKPS